ncbi:MAG: hypothetical protein E6J91_25495 [Deltaproteobacteria bacterium]|nr:MAG: hypothetical protein E6J91_25495 [Deltaproteobacteria bacterium]
MQMAFEDRDGDGQLFLDLETGEAVRVNEHDDDELGEQIEAGFAVTDDRCRGLLDVAIRGEGAFRRFKDVLQAHPAERERWFAFQKERVHDRIGDGSKTRTSSQSHDSRPRVEFTKWCGGRGDRDCSAYAVPASRRRKLP